MSAYAGKCPKHGLVAHEPDKKYIDIKGGAFCPFCGKLLSDVIWKKGVKKK